MTIMRGGDNMNNMNNIVTYQQMVDQPIPTQFEEASGGCQAGGTIVAVLVVIIFIAFLLAILDLK